VSLILRGISEGRAVRQAASLSGLGVNPPVGNAVGNGRIASYQQITNRQVNSPEPAETYLLEKLTFSMALRTHEAALKRMIWGLGR